MTSNTTQSIPVDTAEDADIGAEAIGAVPGIGQPDLSREPIINATIAASEPVGDWPASGPLAETKPDERTHRLMGRLAKRCAGHLRALRRRARKLGHDVARAVRIYSHGDGLAALARRIKEESGRPVSSQTLGNALKIYHSYSRDEYENRFSQLSDTHLLRAERLLPNRRAERNQILDHSREAGESVARMADSIKTDLKRKAKDVEDRKREEAGPPPLGYHCGDGADELKRLPSGSAGFIRLRWPVRSGAINEAGRIRRHNGIIVLDCPLISDLLAVSKQMSGEQQLTIRHTLIIKSTVINREAAGHLPVMDRYRLLVLIARQWQRFGAERDEKIDNPMTDREAEALVYDSVPNEGLVVDIGAGSARTAVWATKHGREHLVMEPANRTHAKASEELKQQDPKEASDPDKERGSQDPWPMISEDIRENATMDGVAWSDLSCCERTAIAAVSIGATEMDCPACHKKVKAKPK